MPGTLGDIPANYLRRAQPDPGSLSPRVPAHPDASNIWQRAKTVVVTRITGPQELVTAPRLVVPVGRNQLAFRVSSYGTEADQLARDGRVLVQPGDWRGNPALGSQQRQGRAQVVTGGTLLPPVHAAFEAKYRWQTSLAKMAHRLSSGAAPYGDLIVLVTVFEPMQALTPGPR
ncbi:hypothetical protein ABIA39_008486 [Nocardia sp. GAS34]|uniref:hypothetical protein n=1 Tax=unclassified Nocardia TaxID=2637762 RepID=UPI003D209D64